MHLLLAFQLSLSSSIRSTPPNFRVCPWQKVPVFMLQNWSYILWYLNKQSCFSHFVLVISPQINGLWILNMLTKPRAFIRGWSFSLEIIINQAQILNLEDLVHTNLCYCANVKRRVASDNKYRSGCFSLLLGKNGTIFAPSDNDDGIQPHQKW